MRYFSGWIPEWSERYQEFREEDVVGVCYRHHEEAHRRAKPALESWWQAEQSCEAALSASSACSASFWSWARGSYDDH